MLRFAVILVLFPATVLAQIPSITSLEFNISPGFTLPLASFELNDTLVLLNSAQAYDARDSVVWHLAGGVEGWVKIDRSFARGWKATLAIRNSSPHKQQIANVVPLGESPHHVYIRSWGSSDYEHRLSRAHLFRPGAGPVGVILPDNAWEMGFCDVEAGNGRSLAAIARRTASTKAEVRRFKTMLEPGGTTEYVIYVDQHEGNWRDGLRLMFRDRWLYDLDTFDNTLFERDDLKWIRSSYLLLLQFAWDRQYYNAQRQEYAFESFLRSFDHLLGGFEAYMIWPTWPRLGLDQRNQWDMYRDLPGGLTELRRQATYAHSIGTKYFIAYNPWDESTRKEEHTAGMEDMLRTIDADGVVLDTWGESSREFQAAADRVKPGVVLYSEGMSVPKDMPGIVAGRVHDAIHYAPPLNLNKLIKPEFAIFRVIQLAEGRIHREVAVSFFNGYGNELNIMRPGRPEWMEEEFAYLGKATKILRENSSVFSSQDWTPLLDTRADSIWVNRWPSKEKTIYTVLNLRPEGWSGPLFEIDEQQDRHYVSLWNHQELSPVVIDGRRLLPATTDGFNRAWLDTRREGSLDCIASFPNILSASLYYDSLRISSSQGTKIVVWAGGPSYRTPHKEYSAGTMTIPLLAAVGRFEGDVVIQAFDGAELIDERIVTVPLARPRLISTLSRTDRSVHPPKGMVEIPAGFILYKPSRSFLSPNEVIPYPGDSTAREIAMPRFFMDEFPVTNEEFARFLKATRYRPKDMANFLRHWNKEKQPTGIERHPVVYVSIEDARAYAKWAGKRLPTEVEWQYAAQGSDGRSYPWGNAFDSTRCNASSEATTAVDAFPSGKSPFGVQDLIGNVWQLTNDVYDNGTFIFGMVRGGSHFNPTSSWWYIPGGPQPVNHPQMLLMTGPSLDRCATVGFRCVKDATQ